MPIQAGTRLTAHSLVCWAADTRDVAGTVEQVKRCVDAGAEIVRITVQGKKEAAACMAIREALFRDRWAARSSCWSTSCAWQWHSARQGSRGLCLLRTRKDIEGHKRCMLLQQKCDLALGRTGNARRQRRARRYDVPLVADIHFQPAVAMMVADAFEKIRVNPGNFADGRKTFEVINYDDPAQFRAEQEHIREVRLLLTPITCLPATVLPSSVEPRVVLHAVQSGPYARSSRSQQ